MRRRHDTVLHRLWNLVCVGEDVQSLLTHTYIVANIFDNIFDKVFAKFGGSRCAASSRNFFGPFAHVVGPIKLANDFVNTGPQWSLSKSCRGQD